MKNSAFGKLNWRDLLRGSLVSLFTSVIMSLIQILQSGHLPDEKQLLAALIAGMASLLGYLYKNINTNSKDELFTKEASIVGGRPDDKEPKK